MNCSRCHLSLAMQITTLSCIAMLKHLHCAVCTCLVVYIAPAMQVPYSIGIVMLFSSCLAGANAFWIAVLHVQALQCNATYSMQQH